MGALTSARAVDAWVSALGARLPGHARTAGRDVVAALAGRLAAIGPEPRAMAALLARMLAERADALRDLAEVEAALRNARGLNLGDLAVGALLRRLQALGWGPSPRRGWAAWSDPAGRWVDTSAVDDRLARARHAVDQPVTLLATALAREAPGAFAARVGLAEGLLTVAEDDRAPWTLRAAALGALPVTLRGEPPPRLVRLARDRAADPWVQAAAIEAVAALQPAWGVALATAELDAPEVPGDHRFVRARAAELLGRLGAFAALAAPRAEPSEHVRICRARALAAAPDAAGPPRAGARMAVVDEGRSARGVVGPSRSREVGAGTPAGGGVASSSTLVGAVRSARGAVGPSRSREVGAGTPVGGGVAPSSTLVGAVRSARGAVGPSRAAVGEAVVDRAPLAPGDALGAEVARRARPPRRAGAGVAAAARRRLGRGRGAGGWPEPVTDATWRPAVAFLLARLDLGRALPEAEVAAVTRARGPAVRVLVEAVWRRLRDGRCSALPPALAAALPALRGPEQPEELRRLVSVVLRWQRLQSAAPAAFAALDAAVAAAEEGAVLRFADGPVAALDADALLDALYVIAHDDLDLSARPLGPAGWEVHVGLGLQRAAWRVAHELSTPRNNKRPAFLHTVDEVPRGPLVAWSSRMAEVAATEVPGRRVASTTSTGWDEHLPLAANLLAAAAHGAVRVATPDGALTVRAAGRWPAWAANRRYVDLARLRVRLHGRPADEASRAWDAAAADAGFVIDREYASVGSLIAPLSLVGMSAERAPWELGLVAAGSIGFWAASTALREVQVRRWRRQLPLVVGGWGSRGKSSVERMKAALFHGLDYTVVCKSTGCEAMLLTAIPGRPAVESFLYRPRDKATIVEQRRVLQHAAAFGAQVTLYECMALNPQYTHILQHAWMKDDLTTLTNTYPDHEDVQGPSGRDVADVISVFVPSNGTVVTSEQHMTPVIRRRARRNGSRMIAAGAEDWELLPRDLLERFPDRAYDRNVALVVGLAAALDVPADVAMRAMADHLLVDLGAFKRYGPLPVDGRTLTFWNGCSANDRASFLSNWDRAGLADHPGPVAVVFNNRADRLARQAVFARIAALDVAADRIFLIGTNTGPMREAIELAWREELRPRWVDLARVDRGALVGEVRARLRVPAGEAHPLVHAVAEAVEPGAAIDAVIAELGARVTPFLEPKTPGDALLQAMAAAFPEGADVTLLGAENIKGTGLDFVYRWISADRVLGALERLAGPPAPARAALRDLATWDGWGRYDAALAARRLEAAIPTLDPGLRADASAALARARTAQAPAAEVAAPSALDRARAWLSPLRLWAAMRRRRDADRLLTAAARGEIGLARLAREARALVDEDKA